MGKFGIPEKFTSFLFWNTGALFMITATVLNMAAMGELEFFDAQPLFP